MQSSKPIIFEVHHLDISTHPDGIYRVQLNKTDLPLEYVVRNVYSTHAHSSDDKFLTLQYRKSARTIAEAIKKEYPEFFI